MARRFGALALHNLAINHPVLTDRILEKDPNKAHLGYLSEGHFSVVYQRGAEVTKIYRPSISMPEGERLKSSQQFAARHEILCEFLGDVVLPQSVSVENHPFRRGARAILINQSYLPYRPLKALAIKSLDADLDALKEDLAKYPSLEWEFGQMISNSWDLFSETGLLPDTTGYNNLVISDKHPTLKLIDGLPIGPELFDTQLRIINQLNTIEDALRS